MIDPLPRAPGHRLATLAVLAIVAVFGGACSSSSGGGPGSCPTLQLGACPSPPPSWQHDVEPLVSTYCVSCHGPGGVAAAQVPLGTYTEVANNRTRAWQQIYGCQMPQMGAATAFPTAAQRQTMVTWLDACGAPNN